MATADPPRGHQCAEREDAPVAGFVHQAHLLERAIKMTSCVPGTFPTRTDVMGTVVPDARSAASARWRAVPDGASFLAA